jgi:L-Ala-D/L-Glu epimerase
VRAGFACFKLKVGLPDDAERVAAVRAAIGPWPALRVDANGAWTVDEAIAAVERLRQHDLQLVEQPCATLDELAAVRRAVRVPIAADEPIATADDVRAAAAAGACDVVNVKLAPCGGFEAARATIAAARESGLEPFLSSTLDGPWGIAAALQLAASERLSLACGLATLELFDAELARALPPPSAGLLAVPQGPGLGVSVDDDVLAEVLVEELEQ